MTLVTSIALAILVFETFEKWYLKLSSTSTAMLIAILFVSSIIVIKKDEISNSIDSFGKNISSLDNVTSDMTVDDATKKNYQWNINDVANLIAPSCEYETVRSIPMGWCRHKVIWGSSRTLQCFFPILRRCQKVWGRRSEFSSLENQIRLATIRISKTILQDLKPSGKYKIAMIGNSWTANHASLVYQECGYQANSILQGSFGCMLKLHFLSIWLIFFRLWSFVSDNSKTTLSCEVYWLWTADPKREAGLCVCTCKVLVKLVKNCQS